MIFYHGLKHFNDRLCHGGPLDFHGGFQAAGQFHPGCGIRFGTARRIYCREMPAWIPCPGFFSAPGTIPES